MLKGRILMGILSVFLIYKGFTTVFYTPVDRYQSLLQEKNYEGANNIYLKNMNNLNFKENTFHLLENEVENIRKEYTFGYISYNLAKENIEKLLKNVDEKIYSENLAALNVIKNSNDVYERALEYFNEGNLLTSYKELLTIPTSSHNYSKSSEMSKEIALLLEKEISEENDIETLKNTLFQINQVLNSVKDNTLLSLKENTEKKILQNSVTIDDLLITRVFSENGKIYFNLRNIGNGKIVSVKIGAVAYDRDFQKVIVSSSGNYLLENTLNLSLDSKNEITLSLPVPDSYKYGEKISLEIKEFNTETGKLVVNLEYENWVSEHIDEGGE